MAKISTEWASIVEAWPDLMHKLEAEVPKWWTSETPLEAPALSKAMGEIRDQAKVASPCKPMI